MEGEGGVDGSQDSAGGQEGLVPPPFSAFPPPPPPPPQNGLALDYGGSLYAPGAVQAPWKLAVQRTVPPTPPTASVS
ncbi:hypothetical protein INR49_030927, partial [Caranx melampygus]